MKKIENGYGLNQCPPLREAIPLGFTQLLVLLLNTVPIPLLIGGGLGLSASEITILIAACLFVAGIGSIIQSIGVGPVGARLPVFLGNSFVFVAPGIAIAAQHGLDTFTGACLVGSLLCLLIWGGLYKQIAKLVKPYISGTIVAILGISLCGVAIGYCAGGTGSADYGSLSNYLLAAGTILLTLLIQRFTTGFVQKCAALFSMVVMTVVYGFMGRLDFSEIINAAWFRVPQPLHFGIRFELGTIVTVTFLCLVALLELLGDQTTAANLAENRLPTIKEQRGGILAQGVSSVLGSLFNLCPTISISANIGLCGLTGVTSRFITAITGILIMLCGICPKICAIFTLIPNAVLGGVALMTFGVIILSGINILKNCEMGNRETTIVGISLAVGIGFSAVADSLAAFPFWVTSMLSGLPGTAITAILLSILIPAEKKAKDTVSE
ncbi:solute carrier family 23 protein [uncultured Anaerotruncus sp.]|uniref:uracil-xanthine permease family protein n=1 Tax=uncultured Anaerotruncus sp. TaxID=905011 RepID=UPI00280C39B9|nr:solute carrier family 23 protein [uncultured Anaerotruncus sp.]